MFNNIKIRHKILLFPTLFFIIILCVSFAYIIGMNKTKEIQRKINVGFVPYQEIAILLEGNMKELQRGMQDAVAAADETKLQETQELYFSMEARLGSLQENIIGKNNEDAKQISDLIEGYYKLALSVSKEMIAGNFSEALSADIQKMVDEFNLTEKLLKSIISDSKEQVSEAFIKSEKDIMRSGAFIITVMILGLLVFMVISYLISSSMNKSILFIKNRLTELADGNLHQDFSNSEMNRGDEIGEMIQSTVELASKLRNVIEEVQNGVNVIAKASSETFSTAESLSNSANEQAASLEEVSSTMEQITANIEQNTQNAQQTEKVSSEANSSIKEVADKSQKAVEANNEIAKKINVINDIAFQTNLLALNAAVEAARAGEHGKGFAVVAAEVKKLAENSKKAAEQIVSLAQTGLKLTQDTGDVMLNTLPKIENTSNLVQEISSASIEQNNGASQVNNAIQQLNSVTQQNASSSEQLSSGAESLASRAKKLKEVISYFKLRENFYTEKTSTGAPLSTPNLSYTSKPAVSRNNAIINLNSNDDDFENF